MVVADELESIENTLDKVFLLDDGHDCVPFRSHGREDLFISLRDRFFQMASIV